MSSPLPPISAFTNIHRKRTSTPDINLPSLSSWSSSYDDYNDFSSSPPHSSPPRTPLTSRYAHSYTHIVSASRVDSDIRFRGSSEFSDDLAASWDRPYHPVVHTASSYPTNGHKTISDGEDHFPPSSEYDPSENYQEVDSSLPDLDSDHSSNSAAYQSPVFPLDSDEEQEDEGEGYSFGDGGLRATFFRTSAERGRWRSDPVPYKPSAVALLQIRKSAPTISRVPTLTSNMGSRPTSEPLPSTSSHGAQDTSGVDDFEASRSTFTVPFPDQGVREASSPHTLPSLTSDRESTSDPEEQDYRAPSSPLPSSSPPLSPMSFSVSAISRSVSPLVFAPSSPLRGTSSPVEVPSAILHVQDNTLAENAECGVEPSDDMIQTSDRPSTLGMLMNVNMPTIPTPRPAPIHSDLPTPIPTLAELEMPVRAAITSLEAESSHEVLIDEEDCHKTKSVPSSPSAPSTPLLVIAPTGNQSPFVINHPSVPDVLDLFANDVNIVQGSSKDAICPISPLLEPLTPLAEDEDAMSVIQVDSQRDNGTTMDVDKDGKPVRVKDALTQDDNHLRKKEAKTTSVTSEKRKKDSTHDKMADGQVKKRQKTETVEDASSSTSKHALTKSARSESIKKQGKRRKTLEDQDDTDLTDLDPAPKAKKQKREDDKAEAHKKDSPSFSDPSLSTSHPNSQSKPKSSSTVHAEARSAADNPETREIVGMLIETMATSRASSLAVSSLYKSVMQSRPSLKTQRSEKEWMGVFKRVLNIFSGGGMGGVFGKVESSGKDDSGRSLEAQWFYVPEMDEDQERATLIRSMMPRPAKRSETKKYKQYYWRPLDKISRWDPEDDL